MHRARNQVPVLIVREPIQRCLRTSNAGYLPQRLKQTADIVLSWRDAPTFSLSLYFSNEFRSIGNAVPQFRRLLNPNIAKLIVIGAIMQNSRARERIIRTIAPRVRHSPTDLERGSCPLVTSMTYIPTRRCPLLSSVSDIGYRSRIRRGTAEEERRISAARRGGLRRESG
jgi:hypothetical protein